MKNVHYKYNNKINSLSYFLNRSDNNIIREILIVVLSLYKDQILQVRLHYLGGKGGDWT